MEPRSGPEGPADQRQGGTIKTNSMFRSAYASRRGLLPIRGFFEWRAIRGSKAKQPFAVAMADGSTFALGIIWDDRRLPGETSSTRTFAIVTVPANDLVSTIHDRMPLILDREDYERWLSIDEADPADLMKPFPLERMRLWPISHA